MAGSDTNRKKPEKPDLKKEYLSAIGFGVAAVIAGALWLVILKPDNALISTGFTMITVFCVMMFGFTVKGIKDETKKYKIKLMRYENDEEDEDDED